MATWLGKQRKPELADLAEQAGLSDIDGLRKDELVATLDGYLQKNATRLSKNPAFEEYYGRTGSPVKREPGTAAGASSDGEVKSVVRGRGRRPTKAKEDLDLSEPSSPIAAVTSAIVKRTPGRPRKVVSAVQEALPASPAVVTDAIERETARLSAGAHDLWDSTHVFDFFETLRAELSSLVGLETSIMIFEAFFLQRRIMPWNYAFDVRASQLLGTNSHAVRLPDLFILLTGFYWSTSTVWAVTRLWIPLVFGWFWNLSLKPKVTKSGVTVYKPRYRVDPLIFHIMKALMTWLVFSQGKRLWGAFADETVDVVEAAMPSGYNGMMISAFIGILASLYDAALKK